MRERVGGVCPLQFAQVGRYRSVNVSRWGLGENSADAPLTAGPQDGQHPDPCHPIEVISHGPGRSPPPECDSEKSIRKNPTPRTQACPATESTPRSTGLSTYRSVFTSGAGSVEGVGKLVRLTKNHRATAVWVQDTLAFLPAAPGHRRVGPCSQRGAGGYRYACQAAPRPGGSAARTAPL